MIQDEANKQTLNDMTTNILLKQKVPTYNIKLTLILDFRIICWSKMLSMWIKHPKPNFVGFMDLANCDTQNKLVFRIWVIRTCSITNQYRTDKNGFPQQNYLLLITLSYCYQHKTNRDILLKYLRKLQNWPATDLDWTELLYE